jgi:diadenosine tetraphosphate (Ap4A) HIT family hydrolase
VGGSGQALDSSAVGAGFAMNDFQLDPQLVRDCFVLGRIKSTRLLLLNNALLPWFILVPETTAYEIYELPQAQQLELLEEINIISSHLKQNYAVDKLNIAAIGNVVRQMHIHVVGRHVDDFCWPGVVWGTDQKLLYHDNEVQQIKSRLTEMLAGIFVAH